MILRQGFSGFLIGIVMLSFATAIDAQKADEKAQGILIKSVSVLGGERYLQARSQIGKGRYTLLSEKGVISSQTFTDVVVFPDKERTDFKGGGSRTIQTNSGDLGWIYDSDLEVVKLQTPAQIANFKQGLRTSIDYLLHGSWKGDADLTYAGRRPSTLGKRNEVVRLTFKDGFIVEFEFTEDGLPQKAIYKHLNAAGEEINEEDRYAQFIDVGGIKTPFIVDRFTNGSPASRINYDSVEFDKAVPDSIFAKPSSPKEAKKDIKL